MQVPKGRSAIAVTQLIRDKFFHGYREAEFIVVCDVQKENNQIIQELNDAQVKLLCTIFVIAAINLLSNLLIFLIYLLG